MALMIYGQIIYAKKRTKICVARVGLPPVVVTIEPVDPRKVGSSVKAFYEDELKNLFRRKKNAKF